MARTLSQIVAELNAGSSGQISALKNKKTGLAGELQADEQALQGQQTRAFGDILTGARRRGLGFSGIPLGEQAQYTADVYLPTLARTRNDYRNRELSLEEAIQGIYSQNRNQAQSLYQSELDRAEQIRQFNENLAFQRAQFEEQRRQAARASGNGGFNFTPQTGGANTNRVNTGLTRGIPRGMQQLYNQVFIRGDGSTWSDNDLVSDYNATLKSARYGNTRDKQKLELYHSVRPDLFGRSVPAAVLANGGRVTF